MVKKTKSPTKEQLNKVTPGGKKDDNFFETVYNVVRQIPKGKVTTYGAIAAAIGAKSSARMVGWALNGAHTIQPPVPAHRVVNRNGQLSGRLHFAHPQQMQQLLEAEGIVVENDTIKGFEKVLWNPAAEL